MTNPTIDSALATLQGQDATPDWPQILTDTIAAFDCTTGTLHILDQDTKMLMLRAQQGIPEFLMPKMSVIPIGKGMAGIAAERRQPVEMCNLQTDESGVVRPSARETKAQGSIAAPLLLDGKLYGVIGIAKPEPYDFTEQEISDLMAIGETLSRRLA